MIGSLIVLALALIVALWLLRRQGGLVRWRTIDVNGLQRRYLMRSADLHARQKPLLICLHGGGGHIEWLARRSGLAESGQRRGFTVIFPEARDGWIDSRPERGGGMRDVNFIDTLIDELVGSRRVDPSRVFVFGLSNGGLFVFRLARERPHRFAGFATALANLPVADLPAGSGPSGSPMPIAMIFGRHDRVMPWGGGQILRGEQLGVGGEVISAEETLQFWLNRNGANAAPQTRRLLSGGYPVEVADYPAAPGGAPVRNVTLGEWGHRWPSFGGRLSASATDFNLADVVTEFLSGLYSSAKETTPIAKTAGERRAHA